MIQENELVSLVLGAVGLAMVLVVIRPRAGRELAPFLWAYYASFAGALLTVAEGFALPVLLNVLEHAALAVAGACFAWGSARLAGVGARSTLE